MRQNRALVSVLSAAAAVALLADATVALAADQNRTAAEKAIGAYSSFVDQTAGGMIGQPVLTKNGAKLGEVADLVVRKVDKVSYAVVSIDSAARKGVEKVVIPYQSLKVGDRATTVVPNLTSADISALPRYDPDEFSSIRGRYKG